MTIGTGAIKEIAQGSKWNMEVFLRQDPVVPLSIRLSPDTGTTAWFPVINNKYNSTSTRDLHRASYQELVNAYAKFRQGRQAYRVTSAGVTGTLLATATTDCGRIVAAQYSVPTATATFRNMQGSVQVGDAPWTDAWQSISGVATEGVLTALTVEKYGTQVFLDSQARIYEEGPWNQDTLLQSTKAMIGQARDGFYMPLRLDNDHRMISLNTKKMLGGNTGEMLDHGTNGQFRYNTTPDTNGVRRYPYTGWPYYGDPDSILEEEYRSTAGFLEGIDTDASVIGHVAITGLHPEASITLVLRLGVEIVPELGSIEAAYSLEPLIPDPTALSMYNEISARLSDCYPADYNDLGALKAEIARLAKAVLPHVNSAAGLLAKMPGLGGAVGKTIQLITAPAVAPKQKAKASRGRGRGQRKKQQKPAPVANPFLMGFSPKAAKAFAKAMGGGK